MSTAFCVCCDHAVSLGPHRTKGQIITCQSCGTLLEVLALDPPELDWAYLEHAIDGEIGQWDWVED